MSKVTITDSQNVTVTAVPANPDPLCAIGKYAQVPDLSLILLPDLVKALAVPLQAAAATPASLGLQIGKSFAFGTSQPTFCLTAKANAAVHVNAKAGTPVFSDDRYGSQIKVNEGEGYLSLELTGSVNPNLAQTTGDFATGFDAGASATFEFFRKYKLDAKTPTVGEALGETISHFVIAADVTDLHSLALGDIAACSGKRHLKVSGEFTATYDPVALASPNLPLIGSGIQLNAGGKVDVTASLQISAMWQIRTRALRDGVIELGVYKQHGSDWDLAITASAGVDATLGTTDLLTSLINKLSKDPKADKDTLAAAGLNKGEIGTINDAISSSIDRSLHGSLSLDLNGMQGDEAAFLYQVELDSLNASTAAAVTAALDGDLRLMDRLDPMAEENAIVGPGVTLLRSILTRTRKNGVKLKVNFLGLFNYVSLASFVSQSQVIFEPVSGDLCFKETAKGDRIDVITMPQSQTKLRKAIFDSVLLTTAYRSSGALEVMEMDTAGVHFALNSSTNEHTMSDYLDWFIALQMLDGKDKAQIMKGFGGTGSSTCTVRVAFGDAASKAVFLDQGGKARPNSDYVRLGRDALQALLLPGDAADADKYRRDVLGSDPIWNQFEGQTAIGPTMQKTLGWDLKDRRIRVLETDYTVIVWWADAMAKAAGKVQDMQAYVKQADPVTLRSDKTFAAKVADLQSHIVGVITHSPMSFDQPFGLTALARAAGAATTATGVLHSSGFSREFATVAGAQSTAVGR